MTDGLNNTHLAHGAFADLAQLEAHLESFAESIGDVAPAAAIEVLDRFEVLHRKVSYLRAQLMTRIHDGGLWAVDGARSFPSWTAARLGNNPKEVSKMVRESSALRSELPNMDQAVKNGEVSWDRVSVLTRYALGTDAQKSALKHPEVGEPFLVEQAKNLPIDRFRYLVRTWADRADPDAGDARWQKDANQEYLVFAKTMDGYHLQGWLSEFNGQILAEALNGATGVPPEGDERTLQQRNAQALVDIAQSVLDSGSFLAGAIVRPHLSVTVDYETLQELLAQKANRHTNAASTFNATHDAFGILSEDEARRGPQANIGQLNTDELLRDRGGGGFALEQQPTFDDGTVLSAQQLAFLACDSTVTRIVFGPRSEVLDVGRAKRTVTAAQRKAVQARDRFCQFPGCGATSYTMEVHHVKHWVNGGETSVDNSILLCRYHHQYVHQRDIEIQWRGGSWIFIDERGAIIRSLNRLVPAG